MIYANKFDVARKRKHWLLQPILCLAVFVDPFQGLAERQSNRIARRRCIFASFGALSLARFVSCCAKSHQNLSKMHSPAGAMQF